MSRHPKKGDSEMKRSIAVLLCGVLLSSVIFGGCNKPVETSLTEESATSMTEAETTAETSETAPAETTPSSPDINMDNLLKISELYASKEPEGKHFVSTYADGIRGGASYSVSTDDVYFNYSSVNGGVSMDMHFKRATRSVNLTFDLQYGNARYYGVGYCGIDDVETLVDEIAAGKTDRCQMHDDSAREKYAESIKKDIPIMYSRFITLADKAFPELGLGIEDIGIDLGDRYRSVDAKEALTTEPVVTKTMTFKNGYCSSKKKLWTEYYYNAIGKLTNAKSGTWHSVYGQDSSYMLSSGDYVQYSSSNKNSGQLYYQHITIQDDKNDLESLNIDVYKKNKKSISTSLIYRYEQKTFSLGRGIVGFKYCYYITISAKPGQYNKVFASKEAFKKNAKVELIVFNSKGVGKSAWTKKANINKLKKNFETDGCTYYTKAQILDKFWDRHEGMLESIDKGMVWLDTDLKDIGINWKK